MRRARIRVPVHVVVAGCTHSWYRDTPAMTAGRSALTERSITVVNTFGAKFDAPDVVEGSSFVGRSGEIDLPGDETVGGGGPTSLSSSSDR